MSDTVNLTLNLLASESFATPTLQPGSVLSSQSVLGNPTLALVQTFSASTTTYNVQRLTFSPATYQYNYVPPGAPTRGMLIVDDANFLANTGLSLTVSQVGGVMLSSVNGLAVFSQYSSTPVPWPVIFSAAFSAGINLQTEGGLNQLQAPTTSFGATLYTW